MLKLHVLSKLLYKDFQGYKYKNAHSICLCDVHPAGGSESVSYDLIDHHWYHQ